MYFKYIFLKSKPIFQSFYINVLSCKLNMIKDNNYCHFYLKLIEFLDFFCLNLHGFYLNGLRLGVLRN